MRTRRRLRPPAHEGEKEQTSLRRYKRKSGCRPSASSSNGTSTSSNNGGSGGSGNLAILARAKVELEDALQQLEDILAQQEECLLSQVPNAMSLTSVQKVRHRRWRSLNRYDLHLALCARVHYEYAPRIYAAVGAREKHPWHAAR